VFGLADGSFIDASEGGNDMRFINHSCAPNCAAHEVQGGVPAVEIWSTRAIRKGEELLLDYQLDIADNDPSLYACRCAAANCRGTMSATTLDVRASRRHGRGMTHARQGIRSRRRR
jgi:SET domain-containing protein